MLRRACLVALSLLGLASSASADLIILDATRQTFGPTNGNSHPDNATVFTLTFNQVPDFVTLDSGNQINSFIGYLSGVGDPRDPANTARMFRGDQIAANGNLLPITTGPNIVPPNSTLALVPYSVNGNIVTFTVDNSLIFAPAQLHILFESYDHGVLTGTAGYAVPEPSSVALVAIGLGLLGIKPLSRCYSRLRSRS